MRAMRWLLNGTLTPAVNEALVRHGHTVVDPASLSLSPAAEPSDILQAANAAQLDLLTNDATMAAAPFNLDFWFNRSIVHWEIWALGGIGVTLTENISRDPADQDSKAFKNTALTPSFGIGSRFFLTQWLTVNFALRDYLIIDKYEPLPMGGVACTDSVDCKAKAPGVVVNNFVAYVGVGMYLPTKFSYKTPR